MKGSYPAMAPAPTENRTWSKEQRSHVPMPYTMNQVMPQPPNHYQAGTFAQLPPHIAAIDLPMQARPNLAPAVNPPYMHHPIQPPSYVRRQYTHGRSLSDYSHNVRPEASHEFVQSHRRAISATTSEMVGHAMETEEEVDSERSGSASPPSQFLESPAGSGSGRFKCPYCQKSFSRPSSLRIHTYSHTGEKPFQCLHPGCDRKFSVQSNMRRHLRVHRLGAK
ncbi:hypothetical protein INT43_008121 [Umbelopsis isabellina]|uniref:C2H2-type domain-containing protein n=1 Tax=Mortierella isabellina TaxID=91625 RepID=A0A8H7U6S0_MORIS|nr:hypothetical protein INT43_008121 [Umbelopsis isabellina]